MASKIVATNNEKICTRCKSLLSLNAFYSTRRGRSRSSACIECLKTACKKRRLLKHPRKLFPDLANEKWMPVPGYEGLYGISNMGRVRREADGVRTYAGRMLKPVFLPDSPRTSDRYSRVRLFKKGRGRWFKLHLLVASVFLPPDPLRKFINHKNGKYDDARAENLERVTAQENTAHAIHVLKRYRWSHRHS